MNRGVTEAQDILAGMKADLDLLLMAVKAEDPYSELRIRVSDLLAGAQALAAALAAEPGAAGMMLVPIEPTVQQIDACLDAAAAGNLGGKGWEELYRQVYRIMLSAAPHQSGESGKDDGAVDGGGR